MPSSPGLLRAFLATTLVICLTMPAFGGQPTTTPDQPQRGGVLRIINPWSVINLGVPTEPYSAGDGPTAAACVETLLRLDEAGLPVPWLATGWKLGRDLKSITLTLRKGVKFHDGTDFNAEAVKYVLDEYRSSPKPELKVVSSIDVINDHSLRLNLSRFEAQLIPSLTTRAGLMVSPAALKTKGKQWCLLHPVGTGPFKFVSFQRDVALKFDRFDGYWQKGKPYLDAIEFIFIPDPVTAEAAFRKHTGDAIARIDQKTASDLQATGQYVIAKTPSATYGLASDGGNPASPFADIRVRQAVSLAIDNETIAKTVGLGFFIPANQPCAPDSWTYNPKVVGYPYNPQRARELLTQAGYPSGFKTKLAFHTSQPQELYAAIQGYLSQVGIDAQIDRMAQAAHVKLQNTGWKNGLVSSDVPAGVGYDMGIALSTRLSTRAPQYVSVIHPADYEARLSEALVEPDLKKRKAIFQDLMQLIVDKHCMVTTTHVGYSIIAKTRQVRDIRFLEYWFHQWTPEDGWLSR